MEEKSSFIARSTNRGIELGASLLCWVSPFVGLGVFFPMGALILYPKNRKIKISAFQALALQVLVYGVTYPLEILFYYSEGIEIFLTKLVTGNSFHYFKFLYSSIGFLVLILQKNHSSKRMRKMNLQGRFLYKRSHRLTNWFYILLIFVASVSLTEILISKLDPYQISRNPVGVIRDSLLYFFTLVFAISGFLGEKNIFLVFRKIFCSYTVQQRYNLPSKEISGEYFFKKARFAKFREYVLPGWGQIFLQRYWKGFPLMFVFLLALLFFTVSFFFFLDPIFSLRYMTSLGLKPGIPDKEIFQYVGNFYIPLFLGGFLVAVYAFSRYLLKNSLKQDIEVLNERGLESGFSNNLHLSILLHLILVSLVFLIPVTLQRSSGKKQGDNSKTHYQPEKLEFYFIDPNIPDEVKDLNGGVVSGTDTANKKEGEKISDEKPADYGKIKGYVKRIKGKKLPKTYSNYISAKMRGPENFMDYWRRAPKPYSSVVAYTITQDGDITDIELVESSDYPEQDRMTLELIESMAPVMPPPGVKGDIRVTELFWNGAIDPEAMPTQLQKEMVLMFDGRYMEEL
ncbi:MAG: energy transducer TonB [Leptospiraceae bacterium]|nr:energy transducer TonB [Leptospiraceae bacterium]MCK6382291.1 energy transducer TonB [Leptospiraceae bacterium]NUM41192.1 energy transducer TonB [Leptospiraceae bacterium]